ncbi:MAG: hypothetical protein HYX42_14790 [Polaromonas sp.]|uniref:hypothetical protein n=1 Tax=Polaromonas sp. TaxID=1869339 RepID=UPI0025EDBBA3|nr:hypothetical protein [Polaromonas sp.]MBI2727508.1 hypothetical protein [Polaromonas sp.]
MKALSTVPAVFASLIALSTSMALAADTPLRYKGEVVRTDNQNFRGGVEFDLTSLTVKLEKGHPLCKPGAVLPLRLISTEAATRVFESSGDAVHKDCVKTFTLTVNGDEVVGTMKGEQTFNVKAILVK